MLAQGSVQTEAAGDCPLLKQPFLWSYTGQHCVSRPGLFPFFQPRQDHNSSHLALLRMKVRSCLLPQISPPLRQQSISLNWHNTVLFMKQPYKPIAHLSLHYAVLGPLYTYLHLYISKSPVRCPPQASEAQRGKRICLAFKQ